MNKKAQAGHMTMVVTFMICLGILGTFISISSQIYFGKEYDFRKVDSVILNYKIKECLQNNFDFSLEKEEYETYIFEKCHLNKEIIEKYFVLGVYIDDSPIYQWKSENNLCALSDKNPTYPKCIEKSFQINSNEITKNIRLLTGSNQHRRT